MSVVTTVPKSRLFTRADLETMPDDGHRYELLDGILIVSPSPSWLHQTAVLRLASLLDGARSSDLRVLIAPLDVVLADDTVLQPDVLVARRTDLGRRDLPAAPILAVEVLSPSTRRFDQLLKHSRYAAAGVASYWIIDPVSPSLTAYALTDTLTYQEITMVCGDETYDATSPFVVSITPADLVADV